jgi:hypothetical protein
VEEGSTTDFHYSCISPPPAVVPISISTAAILGASTEPPGTFSTVGPPSSFCSQGHCPLRLALRSFYLRSGLGYKSAGPGTHVPTPWRAGPGWAGLQFAQGPLWAVWLTRPPLPAAAGLVPGQQTSSGPCSAPAGPRGAASLLVLRPRWRGSADGADGGGGRGRRLPAPGPDAPAAAARTAGTAGTAGAGPAALRALQGN